MTNEQYHADVRRIGKSGLDLIAKCPRLYYEKYLAPNRVWEESTPAMKLGSAFHCAILERHRFSELFIVQPEGMERRSNKGKEEYAAFIEMAGRKTIITHDQHQTALAMSEAAKKHPMIARLMAAGVAEQVFTWTDPETGEFCKAKPDWLTPDGWILDFKKTEDASPRGFGKSAYTFRYHVQAAWYTDGLRHAGVNVKGFIFAAVESDAPYMAAIYGADENVLELGRRTYRRDLAVYSECRKTNTWPGYPEFVMDLELPKYAYSI